jgi:hypothetical protein
MSAHSDDDRRLADGPSLAELQQAWRHRFDEEAELSERQLPDCAAVEVEEAEMKTLYTIEECINDCWMPGAVGRSLNKSFGFKTTGGAFLFFEEKTDAQQWRKWLIKHKGHAASTLRVGKYEIEGKKP